MAISALVLFHLAAVFVAALRVPPVSELAVRIASAVGWYTDAVLVNPGYRFFAPDPGVSHMMRATIELPGGATVEETYPDLNHQWPRLLYHRHFMLTSRLADAPADPVAQALADSYARHLHARHNARRVRIDRRVHLLPTREQVLGGTPLDHENLYVSPYNSPVGLWKSEPVFAGVMVGSQLELRVRRDGAAALTGRFRGQSVNTAWRWQPGPPEGMLSVRFIDADGTQACSAEWPEPDVLVLLYPAGGGTERVPMRRERPALAVYPEEAP